MAKKVLSLGAIAMDIVLNCHDLPKDDGFGFITHEEIMPGGSASNVSTACAYLGLEAYQTGQIGDDPIGEQFMKTLSADKVDGRYVVVKKGGTTLHTYVITAPGGRHCILANPGDSVCTLKAEQLPENLMDEMDIFYNDMFSPEAALYLAGTAVKQNKPVIYNMQCVPDFMEICGTTRAQIEEMLSVCTLFVSGRSGYEDMTGEKDHMRAMRIMMDRFDPEDGVIMTAGSSGAYWLDRKGLYQAPVYKVETLDTTGAGDCFIGGLVRAYYDMGKDKEFSLRFANAAAALKCTAEGPRFRKSVHDVLDLMGGDPLKIFSLSKEK